MLGKGYIIEHYVSFFAREKKEEAYRCYVTDALNYIAKNTANKNGDLYISTKFSELFHPQKEEEKEPEKTAKDIINDIRVGLSRL